MHPAIICSALAFYLCATIALGFHLKGQGRMRVPTMPVLILGFVAASLHLWHHASWTLNLHFFAALSLISACMAILFAFVAYWRPVLSLGIVVYPMAALCLCFAYFTEPWQPEGAETWQIALHASFAFLAYSILSLASLVAMALAMQEHALRTKRFGAIFDWFPALTAMESLLFRLIATGFALLTLTLLSGALFVKDLFAQHLAHKTTLSLMAWVVFATLLVGRWHFGWRGPRAVRLSLIGMILLLLAFVGSKFVLEVLLRRA